MQIFFPLTNPRPPCFTSSYSFPNPTGLEMASESSFAICCCSATSSIKSLTFSTSLLHDRQIINSRLTFRHRTEIRKKSFGCHKLYICVHTASLKIVKNLHMQYHFPTNMHVTVFQPFQIGSRTEVECTCSVEVG